MAYVLGFFAADGCMIKNKRGAHFIEFHITDKDILIKIKRLLNSENKISTKKRNVKWKTGYKLQIGSKIMFEDLLSLGMTPRKSKVMKFPRISDKYISHFIRGYFDGDGNVFLGRRKDRANKNWILQAGFTSGSENFLKKLHIKLRAVAKISGGTLNYCSGAFRLLFSINDSVKLYRLMYNNEDNLFLNRKKRVFEKYLKKKN